LQGRTLVLVSERSRVNVANHLGNAFANGSKIFQSFSPEKPAVVGAVRVGLPVVNEQGNWVLHGFPKG
jgi:hypothetical protein